MKESLRPVLERLRASLKQYQWVLLVLVIGLGLMLLPTGENTPSPETKRDVSQSFDLEALEAKFSEALSQVDGAGAVTVVLSVYTGSRHIYAEDSQTSRDERSQSLESETVKLARGSGKEEALPVQELYPSFQGALIVAEGAKKSAVRLALMEATCALTGLGADKISICHRGS